MAMLQPTFQQVKLQRLKSLQVNPLALHKKVRGTTQQREKQYRITQMHLKQQHLGRIHPY